MLFFLCKKTKELEGAQVRLEELELQKERAAVEYQNERNILQIELDRLKQQMDSSMVCLFLLSTFDCQLIVNLTGTFSESINPYFISAGGVVAVEVFRMVSFTIR